MNKTILISDAGPLIAFGQLNFFPTLTQLLGTIIIPEAVAQECTRENFRPGAIAIQSAVQKEIIQVYPNPDMTEFSLSSSLGKGESTAIVLAIKLNAGLLVDEKLARKTATRFNVKIIGTAGVLLLAKKKGIIPAVSPIIQQLKNLGYRMADFLITEINKLAGE
ncbi:MAG: DUF3368 domain-containing protein [Gammaproteobacteria bacterium]